jgi:hypothetical protein
MRFFSLVDAARAARRLGIDFSRMLFTVQQLQEGMNVELEHLDVTGGDPLLTARIALAHLRERPDYYEWLRWVES